MPDRSKITTRSTTTALMCLLAVVLVVSLPATAAAQRVAGSIGVSLTVLEPVASHAVQVTGLRLERNGTAVVETTPPTSGKVSQVVMTRVSSSANGFAPANQVPALVGGTPAEARDAVGARRLSHRVDIGRVAGDGPRDVQVRIEYLAVAGT